MSGFSANDVVGHIIDAATEAMGFVEVMAKDVFLADARTQKAVKTNGLFKWSLLTIKRF